MYWKYLYKLGIIDNFDEFRAISPSKEGKKIKWCKEYLGNVTSLCEGICYIGASALPNPLELNCHTLVIIKEYNNGSTYLFSPIRLEYLNSIKDMGIEEIEVK